MVKRLVNVLFVVLTMLLPLGVEARVWTVNDLPMDYLEDARKHVCNPDGVLSPAMTDSLNVILYQLEKVKKVQCIVVVVKELEGGDTYTFGMELARKYGIGRKDRNTGLLIVLSTDDRRYSILTGYGLEGTLPDAICKRIENRMMVPYFKKGEWDKGMMQAVTAINGYINGDKTLDEKDEDGEGGGWGFALLFFFVFIFIAVIVCSNARKCPQCGRKAFAKSAEKFLYTRGGWDYIQVVSSCRRCGYSESTIIKRKHEDDDGSGLLAGAIIGSMLSGRGGSGGGFGGGSFGGGSFGGGGASGGF